MFWLRNNNNKKKTSNHFHQTPPYLDFCKYIYAQWFSSFCQSVYLYFVAHPRGISNAVNLLYFYGEQTEIIREWKQSLLLQTRLYTDI